MPCPKPIQARPAAKKVAQALLPALLQESIPKEQSQSSGHQPYPAMDRCLVAPACPEPRRASCTQFASRSNFARPALLNFVFASFFRRGTARRARTRHKHKTRHPSLIFFPYRRFTFTSAIRITTLFPNARAARVIVSSVTDTFRGSSKRSSCDRLVRSSFAIARFVFCCTFIARSNCHVRGVAEIGMEFEILSSGAHNGSCVPNFSSNLVMRDLISVSAKLWQSE